MRKMLAATGLGLSVLIAPAGIAAAAPSAGAEHAQFECQTASDGTISCFTGHSVTNTTITPSGQASVVVNGKISFTITFFGGSVFSGSRSVHFHELFKPGTRQESSIRFSETSTFNGLTCTTSTDSHFANGRTQFENFAFFCNP